MKEYNQALVNEVKGQLAEIGVLMIVWSIADLRHVAEKLGPEYAKLTDEQLCDILLDIDHNASIGVTWDTLKEALIFSSYTENLGGNK